jgi:hypothetical protein
LIHLNSKFLLCLSSFLSAVISHFPIESLLAGAGTDSLIPRGFFDDPLADLKARGVDIKKIEKKQEKREDDELKRYVDYDHNHDTIQYEYF